MFIFLRTHIDHIYVYKQDDEKTVAKKFDTFEEARQYGIDNYDVDLKLFEKQFEEWYEEVKIYEIIEV